MSTARSASKGRKHFKKWNIPYYQIGSKQPPLAWQRIATKGRVFVEGAQHQHMITFLNKITRVGRRIFCCKNDGIEFFYDGPLKGGMHIETDVHPGFMTDWQQPYAVLLTQAKGTSVIHETVYENRFGYTKTLKGDGGRY